VQLMFAPSGEVVDLPDSISAMAKEHSSEMLDANELANIAGALALMPIRAGENGLVVEIGAYWGRTTVFMARALSAMGRTATILSIDPFERVSADPLNPQGSFPNYLKQVRSAGFEDVCVPMVAYSQHAAPAVPDRIGVLVVDGDHAYESVRRDLALYAPKVLPGGLIFMDDYAPVYAGVQKATDEFFDGNGEFAILHKSYFVVARRTAAGAPMP
jgi:methyltransferase family protein